MNKIAVIIRVYNRIQDLEYNLEIIRNTWLNNDYYIIVSSNGENDGYTLTDKILLLSDKIVKSYGNIGHLKGNSQLLMQAISHIPADCKYSLLLEADTWLYKDNLISKYVEKLSKEGAVWASAKWYDKFYSLATDFAIVQTAFLKNNEKVVDFGDYPEPYVANYLMDRNEKYLIIKENMPVMMPSYMGKYFFAPKGRFYVFPYAHMVTHHIENLKKGMHDKCKDFNALSNNFLPNDQIRFPVLRKIQIWISVISSKLFIRRSWYSAVARFGESYINNQ